MKKILALCSFLLMAVTLSATIPERVDLKPSAQPAAVVTSAYLSVNTDIAVSSCFEWPEMPFAGFVPMLGFALEPPLTIGFIAVMEHPPNYRNSSWQATITNKDQVRWRAITLKRIQKDHPIPNSHLFAPCIRWLS